MKVCESMKKVTIRTSGFALLLFGFLEACIVTGIFILAPEIINSFDFRSVFALICLVLFFCFIFYYVVGNKIELTDASLIIKLWKNGMFPSLDKLIAIEKVIKLNDIEFIYLGKLDYLKEIIKERYKLDSSRLRNELDVVKNLEREMSKYRRRNIGFKYIPFMIIYTRSSERVLVSTKPYSKKNFSELLYQIGKMNIEIIFEKGII
jgi:hypothetical protein